MSHTIDVSQREMNTAGVANAGALHNQALHYFQRGEHASAAALLRQAISLEPNNPDYLVNLAVILKTLGDNGERVDLYRRALLLAPTDPLIHANLAAVLVDLGEFTSAETHARQSLALQPGRIDALNNLANALAAQQRFAEAVASYELALQSAPASCLLLQACARALLKTGALAAARERLLQALACVHELPAESKEHALMEIHKTLGDISEKLADHETAESHYLQALQCRQGDPELLTGLGNALLGQGKLEAAETCYRQVLQQLPDAPGALVNLGIAYHARGLHELALAEFEKALLQDPLSLMIYGNIGTTLTYMPDKGPQDLLRHYAAMDRLVMRPLLNGRGYSNTREPEKVLRVGYVSPDFRKHAVAYFLLPLLQGHHRDKVEIHCYYTYGQQDEWTEHFRATATRWIDCVSLSNAELCERIRQDGIDILVDLSGHTLNNRLKVFACKPAPIQLTWMGYVTTTGLSAIDYRLTNADADPPGTEDEYTEQLVRLPGTMWCFRPLPGMPDVAPPPCQRKGHVTFGAFNRYSKVRAELIDCWIAIVAAVPQSRLVMCIPEGNIRHEVAARFLRGGVQPQRLTFFSKLEHERFWALHAEVDIALDPFPFNGGTTTCETLWLGVPVITCTGGPGSFIPRFASRMGSAFLKAVQLPELVTCNEADYVATAITLAGDTDRLCSLRASLRSRMAASTLTDEVRFVREVETAYRLMWHTWLASGRQ